MKRGVQLGLVIGIFALIYAGMQYFTFSNLWTILHIAKGVKFYLFIAVLTFSFPLAMFVEKKFNSGLTRVFYYFSAVLLGTVFLMFCMALVSKAIRLIVQIDRLAGFALCVVVPVFISIHSVIHARKIIIKEISIPLKKLQKDIRIVQLTDLHIGTINQVPFLEKIIEIVNSLEPDLVVITGDLFDGSAPVAEEMVYPLNKIMAKSFFVTGSHEVYDGLDKVVPLMETTKVNFLRNYSFSVSGVNLVGIDYTTKKKNLSAQLEKMNLSAIEPNILLFHAPLMSANELARHNVSLHLAGHTHGGQIFPFGILVRLFNRYVSGIHSSADRRAHVCVSEGVGTWGPPMRFGTNSEITMINLKRVNSGNESNPDPYYPIIQSAIVADEPLGEDLVKKKKKVGGKRIVRRKIGKAGKKL